jgi:ADP-ribose pyrophosphatase YjhB (NUDIX family)
VSTDDPTLNFINPRVAAGVLFTDDQNRILMVVPTYKDYLDIPGGYVENGETPYQAAQREVYEELAIKPPIGRLLVVDWWEDSPEADGGAKLLMVFDGGILGPERMTEVSIDGVEIDGFRFVPESELRSATIPRLANRLSASLVCRQNDALLYLENGTAIRKDGVT